MSVRTDWTSVRVTYKGEISTTAQTVEHVEYLREKTLGDDGGPWKCLVDSEHLLVLEWTRTPRPDFYRFDIHIHKDLVR